jgi:homospermidine synthase
VLADIRNYLGTRWAGAVDWTPLQNRLELFPEVADALPDDPWQFDAFRATV